MFSEPVILPPIVAFVRLVILVSGILMFCAFTELNPTIASIPNIAARRGMTRTNCVLIVSSKIFHLINGGLEYSMSKNHIDETKSNVIIVIRLIGYNVLKVS
jgi:cytochrome b subunit of formate dehydrogenase